MNMAAVWIRRIYTGTEMKPVRRDFFIKGLRHSNVGLCTSAGQIRIDIWERTASDEPVCLLSHSNDYVLLFHVMTLDEGILFEPLK